MSRKVVNGLRGLILLIGCLGCLGLLGFAAPAEAQWQISTEDDSASIKFGFLVQARAEFIEDLVGDTEQNLFFRRLRLLAGGKLTDEISFFLETDSPNLGKGGGAVGNKNAGDVFIQDFVVTWTPQSDDFNLDVGMLLIETSHNSNQSAVSLLATDYAPISFVSSGPIDARVGRDYGVRARGYVFDDKLEYRAGVYQGRRGDDLDNEFRFAGRLVYNVFEPEKGLFYSGTTLGAKRILSFGASYDTQEDYDAYAADIYWDQPVGAGDALSGQVDWIHYDGGTFLPIPEQDDLLVEAGYYFGTSKLMPFIQYSRKDFDSDALAEEEKTQVGLGWMFRGHKGNVKLSYAQLSRDGFDDRDEIWLNFQAFTF